MSGRTVGSSDPERTTRTSNARESVASPRAHQTYSTLIHVTGICSFTCLMSGDIGLDRYPILDRRSEPFFFFFFLEIIPVA